MSTQPRFAIVGTPRSGNMWLRRLLVSLLDLEEISADTPGTVPWNELPERCVLQLHWHPEDALLSQLAGHGFTPIALARHPLDVLISILHFAQHEPRTSRWLNGEGGTERELVGASPWSRSVPAAGKTEVSNAWECAWATPRCMLPRQALWSIGRGG